MRALKDMFIPYLSVVIISSLLLYIPYSKAEIIDYDNNESNINKIVEKDHKDQKLVMKKNYNNITYYYFENESVFVNKKDNKITDVYSIIKNDCIEEFDSKIMELLNLKYPKFIVDKINSETQKTYYLKENELIIYYDVDITEYDEEIFLKVNYNEINNYLKIKVRLDSVYKNESGYDYDKSKKSVALTFDDGPNGEKTMDLLKILEENKAHATFFMVGNRMNSFKSTVASVYNSGNEVGSHTYAHKNLKKMTLEEAIESENATDETFKEITGGEINLIRPPYGSVNDEVKNGLDKVFVNWSVDTEDWKNKDPEIIKEIILNNIKDGDIILFHDLYQTSVDAVRDILPILYQEGYQVMSVSELAKIKNRELEKNSLYVKIN